MGWHWKGRGRELGPELARDRVIALRDEIKGELDALNRQCDADLAACLREELREVVSAYGERKRAAGAVADWSPTGVDPSGQPALILPYVLRYLTPPIVATKRVPSAGVTSSSR